MSVEAAIAELRRSSATRSFILACSLFSVLGNTFLYIMVRLVLGPVAGIPVERPAPAPPTQASGNTVTIGAAADAAAPARDFDTVAEFAKANGLATRTVLSYIERGRIDPAPRKDGREWIIPRGSRILPQLAADSGQ